MNQRLPTRQQIARAREATESLRDPAFQRSQGSAPVPFSPSDPTLTSIETPKISGESPDFFPNDLDLCTSCSATRSPDGSITHVPGCSILLNNVKNLQIKLMAQGIKSGAHLRQIMRDVQPRMREQVYNLIIPHITRFKPPTLKRLLGGPRG